MLPWVLLLEIMNDILNKAIFLLTCILRLSLFVISLRTTFSGNISGQGSKKIVKFFGPVLTDTNMSQLMGLVSFKPIRLHPGWKRFIIPMMDYSHYSIEERRYVATYTPDKRLELEKQIKSKESRT